MLRVARASMLIFRQAVESHRYSVSVITFLWEAVSGNYE
jgi:hypothetical protein